MKVKKKTNSFQLSIQLFKVMQAEQDKTRSERTHEEKSKLYQECEQQRVTLYRSLKRSINKSKYKIKTKINHF
jgi:uncharacterized protein (UPF0333 family)